MWTRKFAYIFVADRAYKIANKRLLWHKSSYFCNENSLRTTSIVNICDGVMHMNFKLIWRIYLDNYSLWARSPNTLSLRLPLFTIFQFKINWNSFTIDTIKKTKVQSNSMKWQIFAILKTWKMNSFICCEIIERQRTERKCEGKKTQKNLTHFSSIPIVTLMKWHAKIAIGIMCTSMCIYFGNLLIYLDLCKTDNISFTGVCNWISIQHQHIQFVSIETRAPNWK